MPDSAKLRPSPEQLLQQVEAEERHHTRGKLKVFLGYASGVGKSFRMFDEGRRRKTRGQDVIVAATQTKACPEVEELLQHFELISPAGSASAPCIDVPAVLKRRPAVCLIDGLAYRNPPGSLNPERWQDVAQLLENGITVITSVNLQYIKEKQSQVEKILGKKVRDSVPEDFLHQADDIEMVDASAEYCIDRIKDGQRLTETQLSELREIALVLAAEVVDHQLEDYLHRKGIVQTYGIDERILVCITPRSNAYLMLGRAKRQADRFHGQLFVAYVQQDELSPADQQMLRHNIETANKAHAQVEILHGEGAVREILRYAEKQGITQIFLGHSQSGGWLQSLKLNPVERLILEAEGMDVRIFPNSNG